MEHVYVFLAEGFEEIEAITPVDMLRRAEISTLTVSISDSKIVKGAHGIAIEADLSFEEVDFTTAKAIVLPGGLPGSTNLAQHEGLLQAIKAQYDAQKWVCAICAAPTVLSKAGILEGKNVTCYPSFETYMPEINHSSETVIVDQNIITSKGPATAAAFAMEMIERFVSKEKATEVASGMLLI